MDFTPTSVAIGVGLVAILTVGSVVTAHQIIPATQDRSARNAVAEVVTAEALCASEKSAIGALEFCSRDELATGGYMPSASGEDGEDAVSISVGGSGRTASYTVSVTSKTGKTFQATNDRQTPIAIN
ncbi:hypothetical protein ACTXJX_11850 [Glutamicibacter ardleyensis]|uniref:hypothetical protein n=1 Tax=Glutamicibacter ardleyensis TaxID=225894 RepID=UPI003FD60097